MSIMCNTIKHYIRTLVHNDCFLSAVQDRHGKTKMIILTQLTNGKLGGGGDAGVFVSLRKIVPKNIKREWNNL